MVSISLSISTTLVSERETPPVYTETLLIKMSIIPKTSIHLEITVSQLSALMTSNKCQKIALLDSLSLELI